MKKNILNRIEIDFEFNSPVSETGKLTEDFDFKTKGGYATNGVQSLISETLEENGISDTENRFTNYAIAKIFETIREKAITEPLDYLQKLTIANKQVWMIDNGEYITIMFPDEY